MVQDAKLRKVERRTKQTRLFFLPRRSKFAIFDGKFTKSRGQNTILIVNLIKIFKICLFIMPRWRNTLEQSEKLFYSNGKQEECKKERSLFAFLSNMTSCSFKPSYNNSTKRAIWLGMRICCGHLARHSSQSMHLSARCSSPRAFLYPFTYSLCRLR